MMTSIEGRIRVASILVIAGMLVELLSFHWRSPLAFFLFLIGACGITLLGIVLFLISLITVADSPVVDGGRDRPTS